MFSIDSIYNLLGKGGGKGEGVAYALSEHNRIEKLLNTPDLWGHNPAVTNYIPAAGNLRQAIMKLVASARYSVDISLLYHFPDGLFLDALREGLLHAKPAPGRRLTVRITIGFYYPIQWPIAPVEQIDDFIASLGLPPEIDLYVASMQTWATSWNHSKMIIADGTTAIAGGHNLWSADYTQFAPVHDLSMQLAGPAVKTGQAFLNHIWERMWNAGSHNQAQPLFWSRRSFGGQIGPSTMVLINDTGPFDLGETTILSLGRMGINLNALSPMDPSDNASEIARLAAVSMSDSHIRLSQQMLGGSPLGDYDAPFISALCERLVAGTEVSIIISDTGATTNTGDSYSGAGVEATARHFVDAVRRDFHLSNMQIITLLTAKLHIAPLRFYDRQPGDPQAKSWMWKQGDSQIEPANHAKVCIFDKDGYYFGSDNVYMMPLNPFGMQEFGFMVAGPAETQSFLQQYWEKGWFYSRQFEFIEWARIVDDSAQSASEQAVFTS